MVLVTASLIAYVIFNIKWFLIAAFLILFVSIISDKLAGHIAGAWMKFAHVLGGVTNRIILGVSYYFMLVPLAFIYRITSKSLTKYFFKRAETYYTKRDVKYTKESLENPW